MNRTSLQVFVGTLLLIALTAAVLVRVRSNYVLGEPGIKLANVPIYNEETNIVSETSAYLPDVIGDYRSSRVETISKLEQTMLPPDTIYGRRIYTASDGFQALISIVLMGTDRTSIHKPQYCLQGQGTQILGSEVITIPVKGAAPYELKAMKLNITAQSAVRGGKFVPMSGLFIYWFVADEQLTPYHGERMWLMGRDLVTKGLLQRWAYVAFYSLCPPGEEDALLERMKSFIAESVPEFQTTVGDVAQNAVVPGETALARN